MKKIVSVFCTLVLTLGLLCSTGVETEASENPPMLDGSYLTHDNESTDYAVGLTRGQTSRRATPRLSAEVRN